MGLSNTSLGYLNYPTQVIFKCCKLIPVMIGGVFIQGTLDARFLFKFIHLMFGISLKNKISYFIQKGKIKLTNFFF